MDKFLRVYSLKVEVDSGVEELVSLPAGTTNAVNTANVEITLPYTVKFSVNRTGLGSIQEASFTIYNLSEKTRRAIQKDLFRADLFRAIQFRAGYYTPDTSGMPIIFNGQIKTAYSYRQGTDFVTVIEAFDGGWQSINTYVSATVSPGRRADDLIRFCASQFKKMTAAALVGAFPTVNKRAEVLMGNAWEIIQRKSGGRAIIDNGQVKVLNPDELIAGDLPIIDSSTGLLGSPKRQDNLLELSMIFEPRFTVWQQVTLNSSTAPDFNGVYKVLNIRHEGIISAAVGGECTTSLGLQYGIDNPRLVGGDYLR